MREVLKCICGCKHFRIIKCKNNEACLIECLDCGKINYGIEKLINFP